MEMHYYIIIHSINAKNEFSIYILQDIKSIKKKSMHYKINIYY